MSGWRSHHRASFDMHIRPLLISGVSDAVVATGTSATTLGGSRAPRAVRGDRLAVASRVVYARAGPVRLSEANTGAEALKASLSAPQSHGWTVGVT